MAVTAEDKKYLNDAGIAAVQKATDDWNKANATGDTAGMAAAAAAAFENGNASVDFKNCFVGFSGDE